MAVNAKDTLSFFKDFLVGGDETTGGIARNTIKGIPKAAVDVGADILRAIPREGASIAASLPGGKEGVPATGAAQFVLGKDPIKSLQTRTKETSQNLQALGVSERGSKAAAPLGVAAMFGLNVAPIGGGGKGKVVGQLIKETTDVGIRDILKKELPEIAVEKVEEMAPFLAKATNRREVQEILRTSLGAKGLPFEVPQGVGPDEAGVAKLAAVISRAQSKTPEIAAQRTEELGKRIKEAGAELRKGAQDERAYINALKKMKGPLADKAIFNPVRDQLTTHEVGSLFRKINSHPFLDDFEKLSVNDGLQKLMRGELPEPKQLENLEYVFGNELVRAVQKHVKKGTVYNAALEALNLPRSLITSFDMSAPLRQGLVAGFARPGKVPGAAKEMFKQVFSQKNADAWLDQLKETPEYVIMRRAGLYVPDPRDLASGLTTREENFVSRLAEAVPWVKASQRAYLGYLNKLRTDVFMDIAKEMAETGNAGKQELEALAKFVNAATGRGHLPGALGRAAPVLNGALFSPRLIASRLTLLNPVWYAQQPAPVRREAIKGMARMIGTGMTILGLAKLAGADVEADPRSTDFGKIKVGNTRWDIWGGFQQYTRVLAQLLFGERKTAKGEIEPLDSKTFPFLTRGDVALNFFTGKLAPVPSLGWQLLQGETPVGEELTPGGVAASNIIPLYLQDLKEAYDEGGIPRAAATGVPGFFGIASQTYGPKTTEGGEDFDFNIDFGFDGGGETVSDYTFDF
jgi:hypothetical protein